MENIDKWAMLAALVFSEVLPFLPTKANGVAHLILRFFRAIK